jgi:hypothetical protein
MKRAEAFVASPGLFERSDERDELNDVGRLPNVGHDVVVEI